MRQERLFRSLYNAVRRSSQTAEPVIEPYSLSTTPFQSTVPNWFQTLWARSVLAVHGVVLLAVVIAARTDEPPPPTHSGAR